ncbi:MAG: hypothetical protein L0H83_07525 [Salinisphaera sp.]|nr:hypothetical protein [Salinisphaera sp.]
MERPDGLLYIRPGDIGARGLLGVQNVVVIVESDDMDRGNCRDRRYPITEVHGDL